MDITEQITKIKSRLGLTGDRDDVVLTDLFNDVYVSALSYCNIMDFETYFKADILLSIVRESVCGLYNQRGNEGKTGYSMGGQGATYDVVYDTMRKKLLQAGCRIWK